MSHPRDTPPRLWRIAADTGGTFTDAIGQIGSSQTDSSQNEEVEIRLVKVLSSSRLRGNFEAAEPGVSSIIEGLNLNWELPLNFFNGYSLHLKTADQDQEFILGDEGFPSGNWQSWEIYSPEEAPVLAARLITGTPLNQPLPVADFRLATTRGTNALLERRGAKTLFCTTRGFAALLEIGTQQRPDLFALAIKKEKPLYQKNVEVNERLNADGDVIIALDTDELNRVIREAKDSSVESVAISFLHSYLNPTHEMTAAQAFRTAGFEFVTYSSELSGDLGFLERARTTVVEAYLAPIMQRYLSAVTATMGHATKALRVMTSVGGLSSAVNFRAKDGLLSGPAGGVVGAASVGKIVGEERLITFDMGGTSTDVSRYEGALDIAPTHTVGGGRLHAPALRIETVAAGGGSICRWDGERLHVGPESAGADPGPACYGRGGPLTITDINLLLGRLSPAQVSIPLNIAAAKQSAQELAATVGVEPDAPTFLEGLIHLADEIMADAIRRISVREGYDPAEYALVAFGGAGGMHAVGVAERLGISRILLPKRAGILSAVGVLHAALEKLERIQVLAPLTEISEEINSRCETLKKSVIQSLVDEGGRGFARIICRFIFSLRFSGQESTLDIKLDTIHADIAKRLEVDFYSRYRAVFGYVPDNRSIELVAITVIARTAESDDSHSANERIFLIENIVSKIDGHTPKDQQQHDVYYRGAWLPSNVINSDSTIRGSVKNGHIKNGPALLLDRHATTFIPPGWSVSLI